MLSLNVERKKAVKLKNIKSLLIKKAVKNDLREGGKPTLEKT